MRFCKYCGKELIDSETCSCQVNNKQLYSSKFIDEIKTAFMNLFASKIDDSFFERGKGIVEECIDMNEGEIPVKQYNIARLRSIVKFMYAEGRMQVTNKRVIFRATGFSTLGKTLVQEEFNISEISGVEVRKDHRISFLNLLFGLIVSMYIISFTNNAFIDLMYNNSGFAVVLTFALLIGYFLLIIKSKYGSLIKYILISICFGAITAVGTTSEYYGNFFTGIEYSTPSNSFYSLIMLLVGILWFAHLCMISFVPNLVILIRTKSASSPIEIRRKEVHLFSKIADQEYTGFSDVMPWEDTELASKELGAMINDINTLGDFGIDKWKDKLK